MRFLLIVLLVLLVLSTLVESKRKFGKEKKHKKEKKDKKAKELKFKHGKGKRVNGTEDCPCCKVFPNFNVTGNTTWTGKADILFVFDGSSNVRGIGFEKMKTFAVQIVEKLSIGPSDVHIAAIQYSKSSKVEFYFNKKLWTFPEVRDAIYDIKFDDLYASATDIALNQASSRVFHTKYGARSNVQRIVILFSSGISKSPQRTNDAATNLKRNGVIMYTIGLQNAKDSELKPIAADKYHYIKIKEFKYLVKKRPHVINKIIHDLRCGYGKMSHKKKCIKIPGALECSKKQMISNGKCVERVVTDDELKPGWTGKVDVVFVLDGTSSITSTNFNLIRKFATDVLKSIKIGPDYAHVAVVQFSKTPRVEFDFSVSGGWPYSKVRKQIGTIRFQSGSNRPTSEALVVAGELFQPSRGGRPGVPQFIILITNGPSNNPGKTIETANTLKNSGIILYTLGIDDSKIRVELVPSSTRKYRYLFVKTFKKLNGTTPHFIEGFYEDLKCGYGKISEKGKCIENPKGVKCKKEERFKAGKCVKVKRPKPSCSGKADVLLILDGSRSVGASNFVKMKKFAINIAGAFKIGNRYGRIAAIQYSRRTRGEFWFANYLRDFDSVSDAIADISYLKGGRTYTHLALDQALKDGFSPAKGARPGVPKIAILMTDGKSTFKKQTKSSADKLKKSGVTIFALGIGRASVAELEQVATDRSHSMLVKSFDDLLKVKDTLSGIVCKDIKCGPGKISSGGKCIKNPGKVTCKEGQVVVKGKCEDQKKPEPKIPKCNSKPAPCSGPTFKCTDTAKGFKCSCGAGYKLTEDNVCIDVNECDSKPCSGPFAKCDNTIGSFKCRCSAGYKLEGNSCIDIDYCESNPCSGTSAKCLSHAGKFVCSCMKAGYELDSSNRKCVDVNECTKKNPCSGESAKCTNTVGSFKCSCGKGYQLDSADPNVCVDVNECISKNPCTGKTARCKNLEGSVECHCGKSYMLDSTQINCIAINYCTAKPCMGLTAKCTPKTGGYDCSCGAGYKLDSTKKKCIDINECEAATKPCSGETSDCENTEGSFRCKCGSGYKLVDKTKCEDINECTADIKPCKGPDAECDNTPGSYKCKCGKGYRVDDTNTCVDVDECKKQACLGKGLCVNNAGGFACVCDEGFAYDSKKGCIVKTKLDMVFIVDGSTQTSIDVAKKFVTEIVSKVFIDKDHVRVGWIFYPPEKPQKFYLKRGVSIEPFKLSLSSWKPNTSEKPNLASVLKFIIDDYSKPENGWRPDVQKSIFLLTTTQDNSDPDDLPIYFNVLLKMGIYFNVLVTDIAHVDTTIIDLFSYPYPSISWKPGDPFDDIIITIIFKIVKYGVLKCQKGYQVVNGKCIDIDECKYTFSPCARNAECSNMAGGYECGCRDNFEYSLYDGCQAKAQADIVFVVDRTSSPEYIKNVKRYLRIIVKSAYVNKDFVRFGIYGVSSQTDRYHPLASTVDTSRALRYIDSIKESDTPRKPIEKLLNEASDFVADARGAPVPLLMLYFSDATYETDIINQIRILITQFQIKTGIRFYLFNVVPGSATTPGFTSTAVTIYDNTERWTQIFVLIKRFFTELSCKPGETFKNGKCEDIDECQLGVCGSTKCDNTSPGYKCTCEEGRKYVEGRGCILSKKVDLYFMVDTTRESGQEVVNKAEQYINGLVSNLDLTVGVNIFIIRVHSPDSQTTKLETAVIPSGISVDDFPDELSKALVYSGSPGFDVVFLFQQLPSLFTQMELKATSGVPAIIIFFSGTQVPKESLPGLNSAIGKAETAMNMRVYMVGMKSAGPSDGSDFSIYVHTISIKPSPATHSYMSAIIYRLIQSASCKIGQEFANGACGDINECSQGGACGVGSQCVNKDPGYQCKCAAGSVYNDFYGCQLQATGVQLHFYVDGTSLTSEGMFTNSKLFITLFTKHIDLKSIPVTVHIFKSPYDRVLVTGEKGYRSLALSLDSIKFQPAIVEEGGALLDGMMRTALKLAAPKQIVIFMMDAVYKSERYLETAFGRARDLIRRGVRTSLVSFNAATDVEIVRHIAFRYLVDWDFFTFNYLNWASSLIRSAKCLKGYYYNKGPCTDIDECKAMSLCPSGATCDNSVGSFKCSCPEGYSLEGNACHFSSTVSTNTQATAACAYRFDGDSKWKVADPGQLLENNCVTYQCTNASLKIIKALCRKTDSACVKSGTEYSRGRPGEVCTCTLRQVEGSWKSTNACTFESSP